MNNSRVERRAFGKIAPKEPIGRISAASYWTMVQCLSHESFVRTHLVIQRIRVQEAGRPILLSQFGPCKMIWKKLDQPVREHAASSSPRFPSLAASLRAVWGRLRTDSGNRVARF